MPYERIEMNPDIMDGKPVVRGTRVRAGFAQTRRRYVARGNPCGSSTLDGLKISTPLKGAKYAACSADSIGGIRFRYSAYALDDIFGRAPRRRFRWASGRDWH